MRSLTSFVFLVCLSFVISCSDSDEPPLQEYRISGTLTIDGIPRTYMLNLPPDYYDAADFSLVIAMHGGGGDAAQFETASKLTEKADLFKFVVVYPEGVKSTGPLGARTWNAGGCCEYARDNNIDDVGFITQLIDALIASYKINPKKIYATGHSNGGMLAYRLACEVPDKVAAIATSACSMVVKQPCSPTRAVPVLHMHSVLDARIPYTGGVGVSSAYFPPLDSILNVWSLNDACANVAEIITDDSSYKLTQWSDCTDDVLIQYYLTQDGGHAWPGGQPQGGPAADRPSLVINANDLLWDFFQQYQLP